MYTSPIIISWMEEMCLSYIYNYFLNLFLPSFSTKQYDNILMWVISLLFLYSLLFNNLSYFLISFLPAHQILKSFPHQTFYKFM
eukprot:UN01268